MNFFKNFLQIYEPDCSLAAGGKYNPTNGFCEAEVEREISLNRGFCNDISCEALTFQSMFQDCFTTSCLAGNSKCQENPGMLSMSNNKVEKPSNWLHVKNL